MSQRIWTAPNRQTIANVNAGAVISVYVRGATGAATIAPTATGVIPHLTYRPTIPPIGTSAFHMHDPVTDVFGPQLGELPTENEDGGITNQPLEYWINLGEPLYCPWPGIVMIEGGTIAGGATASYEMDIVTTLPRVTSIFPPQSPGVPFARELSHTTGPRAPRNSISYSAVPAGVANQIPRGATSVAVPATADVTFTWFGTATTVRINPGYYFDLGALAMGTFASGGADIPLISFEVEVG